MPQLKKAKEILHSMRDEALLYCGIRREILPPLLSLKMVLDTLDVTQEFLRHNRLHLRGISSVRPQHKENLVLPFSS